jgi:hypothetical protein
MSEHIHLIPTDEGFSVRLELEGKQYKPKRTIGKIQNRTFYTYRNPDNMYFKKLNAVGINYRLLAEGGTHFDYIKINYGLTSLETTRKYFLCKGSFLHFKNNNLDKQIFLNISDFGMDKAEAWELDRREKIDYERTYREKQMNKNIKDKLQQVLFV